MARLALAGQNIYIRQHYKKYTVPTDKFVGTANRKPPFAVPTIFVGIVSPTNLSEQLIGNQFSVATILVGTALFPQSLWEHLAVPSFWSGKGDIPNEKFRLPPLEAHFGVGGCGQTDSSARGPANTD